MQNKGDTYSSMITSFEILWFTNLIMQTLSVKVKRHIHSALVGRLTDGNRIDSKCSLSNSKLGR